MEAVNKAKWRVIQNPKHDRAWTIEQKTWWGSWQYMDTIFGSEDNAKEALAAYANPKTFYLVKE